MSAGSYNQHRKGNSKTSKGYYKSANDTKEFKNNSKSKKRKASKRNKSSKNHENTQTPISKAKFNKVQHINEFNTDCDSMAKKKRRKTQGGEPFKHQKNISDNSIMYTSHSCGPNVKDGHESKNSRQVTTALKPTCSPYVTNNGTIKKSSQRSKSTNPNMTHNQKNKLNCFEGFVNIDLSQLPHDMTQREVVETMIRKHELSNFMQTDEDEDTSRYMVQNLDDRRTCRRSQYNKNNDALSTENKNEDNKGNIFIAQDSNSPIDFNDKIILETKQNTLVDKTDTIKTESDN